MMARPVEITSRGLRLGGEDGEEMRLLSGEVHSWRLDPARWPAVLDAVADLGFTAVGTYVPWAVHEVVPGRFDFSGPRDVERFCALAAERGLRVLLRPGPDCGGELPGSGWPRRVLDDPRCQARRSNGQPYLLASATHHCHPPSYASTAFLDEVARWYDAVAPVVARLQYPDGPVVAVQVDNEIGFHFQANAYALDYHPDAVAGYRAFLEARYGTVGALNATYGTHHARFSDVDPPVDGAADPDPWRIDWVAWREEHLRQAIGTMAGMLRERGVDRVPLVHNHHPRTEPPIDMGAMERSAGIDLCGSDIYAPRQGARAVRDLVRHLAGSSKLPWLAELGAGWLSLPWLLPMQVTPEDEEVAACRALLGGLRAANVFMLVERDRWFASSIAADGTPRPERTATWRRLARLLDELDWASLERWAPVLLLENRSETRRVAARDTLGTVVPCFSQVMPLDDRLTSIPHDDTDELRQWERGMAEALDAAGIEHDRATTSSLPDLRRYEAVLVPVLGALDPSAWDRLLAAAADGVRVGIGPRLPSLDDLGRPHEFPSAPGVELLSEPAKAAVLAPAPPFRCAHPAVDLVCWSGGGREVLVTFNASAGTVAAEVVFDGRRARFEPRWTPAPAVEGEGSVPVALAPWAVQVWEVSR